MNLNVPPKKTRTMAGVTEMSTKQAIIRALAERPGSTVRELCAMVGKTSSSTVWYALRDLMDEGKIVREECPMCRARIWRVA